MAASDWWTVFYTMGQGVVGRLSGGSAESQYALVQAPSSSAARNKVQSMKGASAIIGNINGPYSTRNAAQNDAKRVNTSRAKASQAGKLPNLNPFNWLSSLGGSIASGLESGFVNFVTDLWNVIIGPLEVILGAVLALIVLAIYFKNDVAAGAAMLGMAAA